MSAPVPDTAEPQFFAGIGTQKAGTTWLFEYLRNHPEVLIPRKEMHIWDGLYANDIQKNGLVESVEQLLEHAREAGPSDRRRLEWRIDRIGMLVNPSRYREFFAERLRSGHRAFGEITPAYILLDRHGYARICELFPQAKFILILRDPIDRVWSHARMRHRRGRGDIARFKQFLQEPAFVIKTDYRRALSELEAAGLSGQCLVLFYENLFGADGEQSVKAICRHLGVSYRPPDFDQAFNASAPADMPIEEHERARKQFEPVYEYVFERFEDVPQRWRENFDGG